MRLAHSSHRLFVRSSISPTPVTTTRTYTALRRVSFQIQTKATVVPVLTRAPQPFLSTLSTIHRANMATGKSSNTDLTAPNLFSTSHLTAIVTGGGTGIGLMISQALAANGAKVYVTGRREEVLEETVQRYGGSGGKEGVEGQGKLIALPGDVSDKEDVIRMAKEMSEKEPGGIHVLINNAGIARDQETQFSRAGQPDTKDPKSISEHFMKTPMSSWLDTMQTNVAAGYYMSMAFLPLLAKGHDVIPGYKSQVINVSSISGAMKGSSGGQFSYAASKAAFTHVSRMLATTFVDVGVRCNVIAPGVFPSEMTAQTESGGDNKSKLDESKASNPSGRFGHDSDMAATVLFLAGRGGHYYNEQILYPDGGSSLVQPAYK